jgi:hypothetical protein
MSTATLVASRNVRQVAYSAGPLHEVGVGSLETVGLRAATPICSRSRIPDLQDAGSRPEASRRQYNISNHETECKRNTL